MCGTHAGSRVAGVEAAQTGAGGSGHYRVTQAVAGKLCPGGPIRRPRPTRRSSKPDPRSASNYRAAGA